MRRLFYGILGAAALAAMLNVAHGRGAGSAHGRPVAVDSKVTTASDPEITGSIKKDPDTTGSIGKPQPPKPKSH